MKPAVSDPPQVHRLLWHGWHGDVGWDVGANCGQSASEMQARFKSVWAFEPAAECWPYLDDIGGSYSYLPIGLSDADTTLDLIELPDKIDTGQLVSAGTHGMEWDPESPDATVRPVIARTVDSLIERHEVPSPDFLKIDVEGHELKVLYGARRTLAVARPSLMIEFHSRDLHRSIRDLLESFGYTVTTVRHPHYPPGSDLWYSHGWFRAVQ